MKLYAIRDKKTKKPSLLAESPMSLWESFGMAEYALSISCDPQTDEVITLRIEPTEPCEWCGDITAGGEMFRMIDNVTNEENIKRIQTIKDSLPMNEWDLCPKCGRSLK